MPASAVPIHNGQQESASHCRRHRLMRSVGLALVCPNPRALRSGRRLASVRNASILVRWQSRRHGEPSAVGRADDTSRTCVCLDRLLSGYEGHRRCRGEADKPWVNEGWGHFEAGGPADPVPDERHEPSETRLFDRHHDHSRTEERRLRVDEREPTDGHQPGPV